MVVCAVNDSVSVTVALPLPAIAPRLQLMFPAADEHVPWLGVTDTNVAPPVVGQVSERIASGMLEVALLFTLIVYTALAPEFTDAGPLSVTDAS